MGCSSADVLVSGEKSCLDASIGHLCHRIPESVADTDYSSLRISFISYDTTPIYWRQGKGK